MSTEKESSEQRLGEYREGHYSSEMIAAMVKEAFERGRASVKLPSEQDLMAMSEKLAQPSDRGSWTYSTIFESAMAMGKQLCEQIRSLNECDGENGDR